VLTLLLALLPLSLSAGVASAQPAPATKSPKRAKALSPREVFNRVRASIFVVEALDQSGKAVKTGSGVSVRGSEIVTNLHVVEGAWAVRVRQGKESYPAKVAASDAAHDLCILSVTVSALDEAPPVRAIVPVSWINVGDRAYAIGAPEGLELSLSEGLISGIRKVQDKTYIQTSAPISPGSSGGGLFDSQGRLLGITTFYVEDGQNLNFAIPAEYVVDMPRKFAAPPVSVQVDPGDLEPPTPDFGPPPSERGGATFNEPPERAVPCQARTAYLAAWSQIGEQFYAAIDDGVGATIDGPPSAAMPSVYEMRRLRAEFAAVPVTQCLKLFRALMLQSWDLEIDSMRHAAIGMWNYASGARVEANKYGDAAMTENLRLLRAEEKK
jgi:Trypsin-like peptidase domain